MNKRGSESLSVGTVVEFILLLIVVGLIAIYIVRLSSNDVFEKKFLAKDVALYVEGLYASPNKIIAKYPQDTHGYSYEFRDSSVFVYVSGPIKESYPFTGQEGITFEYKTIVTPNAETEDGKSIPLIFEKNRLKIKPYGGILLE
jgi:hypothetical protein